MNGDTKTFCLASRDEEAPAPVLCGVRADGRLEGVLFELALRQSYRNTGNTVLEVVYTFPLPSQAVLLSFTSALNGERKVGTVVAKSAAEQKYEHALAEGDAPVMLEQLDDGMYTANIGNLNPGDEIVLEVRFAQLLAFEQGRLRLAIPTTIAPRYGNAEAAGLQPQQVPEPSLLAEYPLELSLIVAGRLADGSVQCPTHGCTRQTVDGGLRFDFTSRAWLDRDVVFVIEPREQLPLLATQGVDTRSQSAPHLMMAAFQPPLTPPRKQISLKVLVDCSGSMGGDSIASARIALRSALTSLTEQDYVSVSRFGSSVEHVLAATAHTPSAQRRVKFVVDAIDADLGGTEMEAALKAVFELQMPSNHAGADVLLLTDGEIWQKDDLIAAARRCAHRIFAIGVGSSPAEGVLRSLAEATGGACEFATPGESLESAARRMLARIRQRPWHDARVEWGSDPVWQTAMPTSLFGGDTVIAIAGLREATRVPTVRLLARGQGDTAIELNCSGTETPSYGDTLARVAAARRISTATEDSALHLAVDYQLMSQHTNCILVHERVAADKAIGEAELHRVSSMLAAGWGATSTVHASTVAACSTLAVPSVWRKSRASAHDNSDLDTIEIPAFLRKDSAGDPASLEAIALAVTNHLANVGTMADLATHCESLKVHIDVSQALGEAVRICGNSALSWLLLANWILNRASDWRAVTSSTQVLTKYLDAVDETLLERSGKIFDRLLGCYALDSWRLSRTQRLRRALIRLTALNMARLPRTRSDCD